MASTVLPNGIIVPEKFSRDWYADLYHNWQELDNLLGGGTPKDGTLTIQKNGTTVGTFSANQATDETVNIEVPDVNNGTLTIQQNGTTVDTFTANSSSDKTVNIQCVDLTNNQTVGGNKEFTGTTTAHDVIPSATDTYNFGSSSAQWNNAYIKSLTINGVACGDILTHNVSEFVDVSSNQTIGGLKTWTSYQTISGSYIGDEPSSNSRTCLYLTSNRDTIGKSGIYITKFRQNRSQGSMGGGDSQMLNIDVFENGVRTNSVFRFTFKGWQNDVSTKAYFEPFSSDTQSFLGTASYPWADVCTNAINGLNPGALSLPSNSYVNVDTTNWDLTCQNELMGSFTPTADGWLMLHVANSGTNEVNFWIIGGVIRINNKSTLNTSDNKNFNMITIPVEKDKTYNIYGNASEYVAGRSIAYCRFMPCRGNV